MTSDMRGDPSAALLEVLDPEQNYTFVDHYLDVPYDLSDVLVHHHGQHALQYPEAAARPHGSDRDRWVHRRRKGTDSPAASPSAKQVNAHGLEPGFLEVPDRMLRAIIRTYTREAGVRDLERKLAAICRKAARKVVRGAAPGCGSRRTTWRSSWAQLVTGRPGDGGKTRWGSRWDWPGPSTAGSCCRSRWRSMPGRGTLTITGRLGDVMQESARAALSLCALAGRKTEDRPGCAWRRSTCTSTCPRGRSPKTGLRRVSRWLPPSSRRSPGARCGSDTAMTGEITLHGQGAADRRPQGEGAGSAPRGMQTRCSRPRATSPTGTSCRRTVRRDLEFVWVETMDQVIARCFTPARGARDRRRTRGCSFQKEREAGYKSGQRDRRHRPSPRDPVRADRLQEQQTHLAQRHQHPGQEEASRKTPRQRGVLNSKKSLAV